MFEAQTPDMRLKALRGHAKALSADAKSFVLQALAQ
jgi:hypothetical protein